MRSLPSKTSGFTLIEVLIAATILFLIIAMSTEVFRVVTTSSAKAQRAVEVSSVVPLIVESVRQELQTGRVTQDTDGDGSFMSVEYYWRAQLLEKRPAPERFDPDEMEVKTYRDRFYFWTVELTIQLNDYSREFVYEEVTWDENL